MFYRLIVTYRAGHGPERTGIKANQTNSLLFFITCIIIFICLFGASLAFIIIYFFFTMLSLVSLFCVQVQRIFF